MGKRKTGSKSEFRFIIIIAIRIIIEEVTLKRNFDMFKYWVVTVAVTALFRVQYLPAVSCPLGDSRFYSARVAN